VPIVSLLQQLNAKVVESNPALVVVVASRCHDSSCRIIE
jgi:hypothetical protein